MTLSLSRIHQSQIEFTVENLRTCDHWKDLFVSLQFPTLWRMFNQTSTPTERQGKHTVSLEKSITEGRVNISLEKSITEGRVNISLENSITAGRVNISLENSINEGRVNISLENCFTKRKSKHIFREQYITV